MIRTRRGFVALALLAGLGGCGLHYWGKTGASQDDFNRDSAACAKEANPQYGLFLEDIYRACLKSRGASGRVVPRNRVGFGRLVP